MPAVVTSGSSGGTDPSGYLYDHYAPGGYPPLLPVYPLRVLWFSASDDLKGVRDGLGRSIQRPYLGLFGRSSPPDGHISVRKVVPNLRCDSYFYPATPSTSGSVALDALFRYITTTNCY